MSRRKTTEEFIESAKTIHKDSYDYSASVYSGAKIKVKIRCIKHDIVFEVTPNDHVSSMIGCPLCGREKQSLAHRKPLVVFIQDAISVHGDKFDYSLVEYLHEHKKVKIKCHVHNIIFEQTPHCHLKNTAVNGCPRCYDSFISGREVLLRSNTEDFITKSKEKYGNIFDYSLTKYTTTRDLVRLRCVKHDLVFDILPSSHLRKSSNGGCSQCRVDKSRTTVGEFISRANKIHGNKYDYSLITSIVNNRTPLPILCAEHGLFHQRVNSHLTQQSGCKACSDIEKGIERRLSRGEVLSRFRDAHSDKYDYSEVIYRSTKSFVRIYCTEHNHWFTQRVEDHFSHSGCSYCLNSGFSKSKPAYIYINSVSVDKAIKVGITNVCPIKRARDINRKSLDHDIVNIYSFHHEDGNFIFNLEKEILNSFVTGVIPKSEMDSGYTETLEYKELTEVLDIINLRFEQYPNVYKEP